MGCGASQSQGDENTREGDYRSRRRRQTSGNAPDGASDTGTGALTDQGDDLISFLGSEYEVELKRKSVGGEEDHREQSQRVGLWVDNSTASLLAFALLQEQNQSFTLHHQSQADSRPASFTLDNQRDLLSRHSSQAENCPKSPTGNHLVPGGQDDPPLLKRNSSRTEPHQHSAAGTGIDPHTEQKAVQLPSFTLSESALNVKEPADVLSISANSDEINEPEVVGLPRDAFILMSPNAAHDPDLGLGGDETKTQSSRTSGKMATGRSPCSTPKNKGEKEVGKLSDHTSFVLGILKCIALLPAVIEYVNSPTYREQQNQAGFMDAVDAAIAAGQSNSVRRTDAAVTSPPASPTTSPTPMIDGQSPSKLQMDADSTNNTNNTSPSSQAFPQILNVGAVTPPPTTAAEKNPTTLNSTPGGLLMDQSICSRTSTTGRSPTNQSLSQQATRSTGEANNMLYLIANAFPLTGGPQEAMAASSSFTGMDAAEPLELTTNNMIRWEQQIDRAVMHSLAQSKGVPPGLLSATPEELNNHEIEDWELFRIVASMDPLNIIPCFGPCYNPPHSFGDKHGSGRWLSMMYRRMVEETIQRTAPYRGQHITSSQGLKSLCGGSDSLRTSGSLGTSQNPAPAQGGETPMVKNPRTPQELANFFRRMPTTSESIVLARRCVTEVEPAHPKSRVL